MEFARVLSRLDEYFAGEGARYAVVGGLALAAYGLARTTLDVDIAADRGAQERLVAFLEGVGYRTLHRSSGYSNHVHDDPAWGRVDVVYVDGATAERLFAACHEATGPGGRPVRVPRPEHLAAMKVLAMKNDPQRAAQELADVRFLLTLPGVDRGEVRGYFERHGLEAKFDELARTL